MFYYMFINLNFVTISVLDPVILMCQEYFTGEEKIT